MPEGKGCSVVAVIGVALLALIGGAAAGAGGLYFWFQSNPVTTTVTSSVPPIVQEQPCPVCPVATAPKTGVAAAAFPLEETVHIEGPLAMEEVKQFVLGSGKRFKFRDCYQKGLANKPDLKGELSLQFTVAASNGKVTAALERHTSFPDAAVRECILNEIRSWEFKPKPKQSVVKFDLLLMSLSASEP